MNKLQKYSCIEDWNDIIVGTSKIGHPLAVALFNSNGELHYANNSMLFFLDTNSESLNPTNSIVNPVFSTFLSGADELRFEGMLTIGNFRDLSYALESKVYQRNNFVLVLAKIDIQYLYEENKKMSVLNQQVNNLQRQLIKEKVNLQNTLSELKETQQMLIHSEKMNAMGKLVAGVAHEVNNPISFVYSNLHSLDTYTKEVFDAIRSMEQTINNTGDPQLTLTLSTLRKKSDLDYLEEDIADMTKESKMGIERVRKIVEDLRNFSRLDESEVKRIDLIENIKSTITIAKSEISRKKIQFQFSSPDELEVDCFPGQLNQAVLNVLINAIQAVDNGGEISLHISEDDYNVIIAIKDNGCGMPKDIQNRIFEPFFTTKPVGSGTGLGLSLTYKIIHNLHNGVIEIESSPNKGSIFKLSIPKVIKNDSRK